MRWKNDEDIFQAFPNRLKCCKIRTARGHSYTWMLYDVTIDHDIVIFYDIWISIMDGIECCVI